MPRGGEYKGGFPARTPRPTEDTRTGLRQVTGLDPQDRPVTVVFDPAAHTCAGLAGELADQWVELAASTGFREGSCRTYRHATSSFCTHVDATVAAAQDASLAREMPDLHHAVTEWNRLLPAHYSVGSRHPHALAGRLRILIARRLAHPDRPSPDTSTAGCRAPSVCGAAGARRSTSSPGPTRRSSSRPPGRTGSPPRRGSAPAARGDGATVHRPAHPHRRQADQEQPLARGQRQPSHDEPCDRRPRRAGQPRRPKPRQPARSTSAGGDHPPPPTTEGQPATAPTTSAAG